MFTIGDYIVKSGEGVCRITETVYMDSMDGEKLPYYLLSPVQDSRSTVYIPVSGAYRDVRAVMQKQDAEALIASIPEIRALSVDTEKQREQTYKDVIRSCDPGRLVGLLKYMCIRSAERRSLGKKNTAMDDRYMKLAENALYSELAFVLESDASDVRDAIASSV
ncbi:MAG: CarD family transcriptional regulator [Lachnospiraceae bacterium]|nr:CarD family transcriptional regulator [Lachnospiraceae bacterium]MBP5254467.1 CarD family transcriptional regulator [Lachnospiraceae bacterium]